MKIDNIDKFGNCVCCHRHLVKNVILNGKVEGVLDGDADTSYFKLTNGSILVVPICKPCKKTMDLHLRVTQDTIMDSVQEGWTLELHHMRDNKDKFPEFTEDKKKQLIDYYASCVIQNYEPNHVMR